MSNPNSIEPYLSDKRRELIWALVKQGYTDAQVGRIFNLARYQVKRITDVIPLKWESPWIKKTKTITE